jgi:Tol biopolymer transport system component
MKNKFLTIFLLMFLFIPGCAVRLPSLPSIPKLPKVFDRIPFIPDQWIYGYMIDTTIYQPPKLLDSIPPFLWLTYPENGDTLTKLHPVAGLAIDDGGIDSVILHLDSFLIKKQVTAGYYNFTLNTTHFADTSEHIIYVSAYDTIGNKSSSDSVLVYFDQSRGYPRPVEITNIEYDSSLFRIDWQQSYINDFSHYQLSAVDSLGGDTLEIIYITTIDTPNVILDKFDPSQPRWYLISVVDTFGFSASGQLTKVLDSPPLPSRFLYINHDKQSFHLMWSKNTEKDFAGYILYGRSSNDTSGVKELWSTRNANDTVYVEENIPWGTHRVYTLITKDYWGFQSSDSISGDAITKILFFGDRHGLSDQLDIFSLDMKYREEMFYQQELSGSIMRLSLQDKNLYIMDNPIQGQREIDKNFTDPPVMWIESLATNPFDTTNSLKFDMAKKYYDVFNKTNGNPSSRLGYPMHFSPDGNILFFTDNNLGDPNLVMMDIDSGEVSVISSIHTGLWFDMHPLGDTLVFVKNIGYNTAIYSLPLDSGASPIRLSYETNSSNPVFSSDGSLVIYTARDQFGSKNLYSVRTDGTNYKKVTTFNDPADIIFPVGAASIDSTILYVMSSQVEKDQLEIWSIHLNGSNDRFLSICTLNGDDRPRLSPNGKKVLFQNDYNLWTMDIDGSEKLRLTDFVRGHVAYHGQWSPSGSHIVYIHRTGEWGADSFIEWIRSNGKDFSRLSELNNIIVSGGSIQPNNSFRFWPVFQP